MRICASALTVVLALTSLRGSAAAQQTADLEALKQELQGQIDAANKQIDGLKNDLTKERETRQKEKAEADKALLMRVGRLVISMGGFLHADWVAWRESSVNDVDASGTPLNEERFLIRRARLRMEGDYGFIHGGLEFDGHTITGPTARLIAAEVGIRWPSKVKGMPPYIGLTLGLFKMTYGFEIMIQSDKERLFLERSNVMRALFPGEYDAGIKAYGGWRLLRYALAVMNGNPVGEKQFAGRDPNDSKDVIGRVGVNTKVVGPFWLAGGFSFVWGTGLSRGQVAQPDSVQWKDTNMNGLLDPGELVGVPAKAASPSMGFQRWAVGGDLRLNFELPKVGGLMVYGEIAYANNLDRGGAVIADPIAKGRDLREFGWYIAFTQELTKWAMVGVRYDTYINDLDGADNTFSSVAATVAARYPGYARLMFQYDWNTRPGGVTDHNLQLRGEIVF